MTTAADTTIPTPAPGPPVVPAAPLPPVPRERLLPLTRIFGTPVTMQALHLLIATATPPRYPLPEGFFRL